MWYKIGLTLWGVCAVHCVSVYCVKQGVLGHVVWTPVRIVD